MGPAQINYTLTPEEIEFQRQQHEEYTNALAAEESGIKTDFFYKESND